MVLDKQNNYLISGLITNFFNFRSVFLKLFYSITAFSFPKRQFIPQA